MTIPFLSALEKEYVTEALASTWISSTGKFVERFEHEFAEICGVRHALSVANGTVALELALRGLGIGPGDEVIVPDLAYVAVANAVQYVGAQVVTCDVDLETWCLDLKKLKKAITPWTKAIIAVHNYGMMAPMPAICALAKEHQLYVVEDAAEAHFGEVGGKRAGAWGDVATFSFYGNKIVTCGEGGAVVTNSDELVGKMRLLRGQGMDPSRRYWHSVVGHNFRLTNIACAILCAQLERREEILEERWRVYGGYIGACVRLDLLSLLKAGVNPDTASPWLFPILTNRRDHVMRCLDEKGIETRPFFYPVSTLPPYRYLTTGENSLLLSRTGMNLPTYPSMTERDILDVVEAVGEALR